MALRSTIRPHILLLHIGWARRYRGYLDDPPVGSFGYLKEGNENAGEALNFRAYKGRCYGYAPHHTMKLARLGGAPDDEYVDHVLVIWTGTDPAQGGRYMVGWYRDARVYSHLQDVRPDNDRPAIIAEAAASNCHLVPVDERTFFIPNIVKGWPGISPAPSSRARSGLGRIWTR